MSEKTTLRQLAAQVGLDAGEALRLLSDELGVELTNPDAAVCGLAEARLRAHAGTRCPEHGAPRFVRFDFPGRGPSVGVVLADDVVADFTAVDPGVVSPVPLLRRLVRDPRAAEREVADLAASAPRTATISELEASGALLPPVDAPEVWAAGVTYERSRDARDRETKVGAAGETPYDRVYAADRPELFFKATGYRVVGSGRPVGLRGDSKWQVPEPELGLVLDQDGAILGYTMGNDMSSRDIEGENPLYLPQAKVFRNSCTLGPSVLAAGGSGAGPFPIACAVRRRGAVVWQGETSTAHMRRSFSELVGYLLRHNWVPAGTVLLTGTGLVPPDDFTLEPGDEVVISSPGIGSLRNVAALV